MGDACGGEPKRLGVEVSISYYQHRIDRMFRSRMRSGPWRKLVKQQGARARLGGAKPDTIAPRPTRCIDATAVQGDDAALPGEPRARRATRSDFARWPLAARARAAHRQGEGRKRSPRASAPPALCGDGLVTAISRAHQSIARRGTQAQLGWRGCARGPDVIRSRDQAADRLGEHRRPEGCRSPRGWPTSALAIPRAAAGALPVRRCAAFVGRCSNSSAAVDQHGDAGHERPSSGTRAAAAAPPAGRAADRMDLSLRGPSFPQTPRASTAFRSRPGRPH